MQHCSHRGQEKGSIIFTWAGIEAAQYTLLLPFWMLRNPWDTASATSFFRVPVCCTAVNWLCYHLGDLAQPLIASNTYVLSSHLAVRGFTTQQVKAVLGCWRPTPAKDARGFGSRASDTLPHSTPDLYTTGLQLCLCQSECLFFLFSPHPLFKQCWQFVKSYQVTNRAVMHCRTVTPQPIVPCLFSCGCLTHNTCPNMYIEVTLIRGIHLFPSKQRRQPFCWLDCWYSKAPSQGRYTLSSSWFTFFKSASWWCIILSHFPLLELHYILYSSHILSSFKKI